MADALRSPVGMGAGARSAYEREGAVVSGRSLTSSGSALIAGGGEWIDPELCGGVKSDGTRCNAHPVNGKTYCIGHLRGTKEGE